MRAIAAVVLVLVLPLPLAAAPPTRAVLRLEATAPLTVRGTGFAARESVTLTVTGARARGAIVVRAKKNGTLTGRFPRIRVVRCTAFTVRAVGFAGSRAILVVRGCRNAEGPPERALEYQPNRPD
jgi:hypothetical protein